MTFSRSSDGPRGARGVSALLGAPGERRRLRLVVHGAVQGVGFRPFVYRLAGELGVAGRVVNDPRGVTVEIEGAWEVLERFRERLAAERPPLAVIHELEPTWFEPRGEEGFRIETSEGAGVKTAVVVPDAATCPECLAEILDPSDRRYRYPFTNCTHCGPRFTIVRELPYDRPNTTMAGFRLCPSCRSEYEDPADRRFHAQPTACPECGPRLALWDADGRPVTDGGGVDLTGDRALQAAAEGVRRGRIVAVKGLGGFQLLVDARDGAAVERLRRRKRRFEKPFALMAADLETVGSICRLPEGAAELLASPPGPIVLLPRLGAAEAAVAVAEAVAPGHPELGVMLPTTPLHHLLLRDLGFPVVATSGNLSDEPIATDEREAPERLCGLADLFLVHDRPIERHADDSVVRFVLGEPRLLRRARGYAPMPLVLPEPVPTVLALGAHLKNTVALSVNRSVYVSQHLGDMETPQTLAAFERVVEDFLRLYEARPVAIAHDLHPDYASTRHARRLAEAWNRERAARGEAPVALIGVQHHHAHLVSCLAEHGQPVPADPVLGVTFDGTGYGTDGTIWGGELLLGDAEAFRRIAHLRPFRLPGGDAAVREPRRVALALLWEVLGDAAFGREDLAPVAALEPTERRLLARMLEAGIHAPVTTSAGRLFDGVAALVGLLQTVSYEGQAAIALEHAAAAEAAGAAGATDLGAYPIEVAGGLGDLAGGFELDWRPLVRAVLADLARGVPAGRIAGRFHEALAAAVAVVAGEVSVSRVALSGGCFQNRRLTEATVRRLEGSGFQVLLHRDVPPNDGGVSLGQVAVAATRLAGSATMDIEEVPTCV